MLKRFFYMVEIMISLIFSTGKDKGNHYWALPNHAFDNVLAVVKVGPQSKMGL